ncbi:MAG TPA: hypothetical protein GXX29_07085 [Firmicutes bacterium]|nr:hypothetical protein [Bacillota bacterium]
MRRLIKGRMMWNKIVLSGLVATLLVILAGPTVSAQFAYSIKPVNRFTMPKGNIIVDGDLITGIPHSIVFNYDWNLFQRYDPDNYMTGMGSLMVWHEKDEQGCLYIDLRVDGSKKYKFGFLLKVEDLTLVEDGSWLRWGLYLKDGKGAWLNMDSLKEKPADYLNGMVPNGTVIYTPREIDLGDGPKVLTGSTDWLLVEITADLPALAADLNAGGGRIASVRLEQSLYYSYGKVWINCVYAVPVTE